MAKNIEILFRKILDKKVAVFCGAGISYNSGVPLVKYIKSKILSALPFDHSDFAFLMDYSMPFELFMESLIENSSSTALLELFEIGLHNTNHLFIAQLAKKGYLKTIVTTNFDNFFETALDEMKVEFTSYYKESDFNKINWEKDEVRLVKLHGSIHDKPNMAVTIKKVSSQELVYMRNSIILNLLKNSNTDSIIFLGYSCSDIFDINPTISKSADKTKTIFFLQHESIKQVEFIFAPIQSKLEPNPFKDFNGYLIQGNTDNFISEAWVQTLHSQYPQTIAQPKDWEQFIIKWIEEATKIKGEEIVYFLAGQLLIAASNHSKSLKYFLKGYELSEKTENYNLSIDFLFSIGRAYRDMQRLDNSLQNSIRYLHLGLSKCRKHKLQKKECIILLSLGVSHEDKKDHESAIKYYEDALKIAEQLQEKIIISKCLYSAPIGFVQT